MNIVLCCTAVKGKGSYTISKKGKVVSDKVFKIQGTSEDTLKHYTLESIFKGLLDVKERVSHEDLLLIEVGNVHLCDWLNGATEYKGYEDELDKVFDALNKIDCRYMFAKTDVKKAKSILGREVEKVKLQGISSLDEMV